jgi:transcriptional regulator with XRE-family HTH domain
MAETYAHVGALSTQKFRRIVDKCVDREAMVTVGTTKSEDRDRAMRAGEQLDRAIRRAMGAADIRSLAELARSSRVQRDTLYAWFRGERPPKPETLGKVAAALGVPLGTLWDYGPVPTTDDDDAAALVRGLAVWLRQWKTEENAQLAEFRLLLDRLAARALDEPDKRVRRGPHAPRAKAE